MSNVFSKVDKYYNYDEFATLVEQLVVEEKTTGPDQSERLVAFTKLNAQRMKRVIKTTKLSDELVDKLKSKPTQIWWLITEAWCGDSAQNLPVFAKLAAASGGSIELRILLRDDNPEIMDNYLTNGGRSIPKLVAQEGGEDIFTWGPRPQHGQDMLKEWKADPNGRSHDDFEQDLHAWYAKNRGADLLAEVEALIK